MHTIGKSGRLEVSLIASWLALSLGCDFKGTADLGGAITGGAGGSTAHGGTSGAQGGSTLLGGTNASAAGGLGGERPTGSGGVDGCSVTTETAGPFKTTYRFSNQGSEPVWLWSAWSLDFELSSCHDGYQTPLTTSYYCSVDCDGPFADSCVDCEALQHHGILVPAGEHYDYMWNGLTHLLIPDIGCGCFRASSAPAGHYRVSVPVWTTNPGSFMSYELDKSRSEPDYLVNRDFVLEQADAVIEIGIGEAPTGSLRACRPLETTEAVSTSLSNLLAVGQHPDTTYYVIDQPKSSMERVFVSEGSMLKRVPVAGSGSGNDPNGKSWASYSITQEPPFVLKAEFVGNLANRMGVLRGTAEQRDFTIGDQGDLLEIRDSGSIVGLAVKDLPGVVHLEYIAEGEDGALLVVTRPEYDWTSQDFRLFYGSPQRLHEEHVSNVTRTRSGSTTIDFIVDDNPARADFPSTLGSGPPLGSSLTIHGASTALTMLEANATDELTFYCFSE